MPPSPARHPNVELKGVARTANVRLEIELEGKISVELATAADEVLANPQKARFE